MLAGATPTKGRLLLATPQLDDPNFERVVIYVLEHHEGGAVGVILNRPSGVPLHEPIDRWTDKSAEPAGLFEGGPVEEDALIALALTDAPIDEPTEEFSPVSGRIASVDLTTDPTLASRPIEAVRVFRGYAGWGGGQLDNEIETGSWIIVDAEPDDVFSDDPTELWRMALRRQPGRLSWLAEAPDDLHLN